MKSQRTFGTFTSSDTQADASACKRAKFLPTLCLKPKDNFLNLTNSGQVLFKSMTLGQKIKELREEVGLKQRELASKLNIGEGFLSKVENNQKLLKRDDLKKLSEIFNIEQSKLETLWLGTKVYDLIKNETCSLGAIKVAEEQVKYNSVSK